MNKEELYFSWWLDELKENGFVLDYQYEPRSFELYAPLEITYEEQLKTRTKQKSFHLFQKVSYTPDFWVKFTKEIPALFKEITDGKITGGRSLFYGKNNELWFDVKPESKVLRFSAKVGSAREFPIKQREMWEKYSLYVNKVVPLSLFSKTYAPERYFLTDGGGKERKIKKDYETIFVYLKNKVNLQY